MYGCGCGGGVTNVSCGHNKQDSCVPMSSGTSLNKPPRWQAGAPSSRLLNARSLAAMTDGSPVREWWRRARREIRIAGMKF